MKRRQVIQMNDTMWALFDDFYTTVKARAKKRGLPPVDRGRLTGAILSYFFMGHYNEVLAENCNAAKETTQQYLKNYFSPGELATIGATVGSNLSKVP